MVDGRGQAADSRRATADRDRRARWPAACALLLAALLGLHGCAGPGSGGRGPSLGGASSGPESVGPEHARTAAGTEIVMQALAQVGKPYRWGGADPETGFDCSGLVAHVYGDALGIRLPRTSRDMSRRGGRVSTGRLAPGDLVFFNTSRRAYSHVGIYVGDGRFVHAPSTGSLVRVERMDSRYWASRFNGARRIVLADAVSPPRQSP